MEDVFKTLNLSDDNGNFRVHATMIKLYNAPKFITIPFFIQKVLTFNLGVAFLKSVSICFKAKMKKNNVGIRGVLHYKGMLE